MDNDGILKDLEPQLLWQHFEAFTKIARPSGKEQGMIEYVKAWANEHKFSIKTDAVGNVAVTIPATPGFENKPILVLQGHLDMVCEKNADSVYDAEQGKINLIKDGDWITADGTTLGADNGIGSASLLAVVDDPTVKHGPLELLFTVDEETGMTGAKNLAADLLTGRLMLNLDSEEDHILFVGCAGGQDVKFSFAGNQIDVPAGFIGYQIIVSGLKGGHSGIDINNGRQNAIHVLARLIQESLRNCLMVSFSGGSKRNAIPREAKAIIAVPVSEGELVKEKIKQIQQQIITQFKDSDSGLEVVLEEVTIEKVFDQVASAKLLNLLRAVPSGVIAMSQTILGLVETSTNFGVVNTIGEAVELYCLLRSSSAPALEDLVCIHEALGQLAGVKTERLGHYPGWQPDLSSKTLAVTKAAYQELFKHNPEITAVHAGLECGLIGQNIPGMDMVSFGPLITGAHSPAERVNIPSVEKFWRLLVKVIGDIAK